MLHTESINRILLDAVLPSSQSEAGNSEGADTVDTDVHFEYPFEDLDFADLNNPERPQEPQFSIEQYYDSNNRQREQDLNRLCGRWMPKGKRCGVEISRRGEHYVLTYLKSNGNPTDERYILIWSDGDILYYGFGDRITVLALNTQDDTLLISPGMDYNRVSEGEKK